MGQVHIVIHDETSYKAIYLNGRLVIQGDNISIWSLLGALGVDVTHEFQEKEWFFQENGDCPTHLPEVKHEQPAAANN